MRANVTARYINSVLQKNNVDRQAHSSWLRKYSVNEDYFKTWSASMAYVLGFFAADGNMPQDLQMVSFSQKDPKILEDIRNELQSTHPIKSNPRTGVHLLNISSKIMKEDLMHLHGMIPNKSKTLEFPYVPEEYLSHFIRGYFDGDGNISYQRKIITFVGGSEKFMMSFNQILERNEFEPVLKTINNHFRIFISGRKAICLFAKWIYQDKNIHLTRKYNEFLKEKEDIKNLKDRVHKNTKEAALQRKWNFLKLMQEDFTLDDICLKMKIKHTTYKLWIKKDKEFSSAYYDIQSSKN